jgi:HlyD family secretion protein
MKRWLRRGILAGVAVAAAYALWAAFRPQAILVDTAPAVRGDLTVTVDDDGRTRVRERYVVSAPIAGRLLRTVLEPGDGVRGGETIVAEFAPVPPVLLDARSRAEAQARLQRAEAAVDENRARAAEARERANFLAAELKRQRDLAAAEISGPAALEQAESAERAAREAQRAAELAVQVARYELDVARAALIEPTDASDPTPPRQASADGDRPPPVLLHLRSPIDGRVLRVFEESARALAAGAPILEVGNPTALEVVADYLTQDAVRVRPGMRAWIEGWGGEDAGGTPRTLQGVVRLVEPSGYTKVSALGVEEQRVDVIVDPAGAAAEWEELGDGYRVELRIVVDEAKEVLLVPAGALLRRGDGWAAFVVEAGIARLRAVTVGRRTGLSAEVIAGLAAGEVVITYPSDLVADGTSVRGR